MWQQPLMSVHNSGPTCFLELKQETTTEASPAALQGLHK